MVLVAVVCGLGTVGCATANSNGADDAPLAPRRPTAAEASLLAGALARNGAAGGARYQASTTLDEQAIEIDGQVDWSGPRVAGDVSGPSAVRFVTDGAVVDETFAGLPDALAAAGHPGVTWVQRPFMPDEGIIDIVTQLVVGLASDARDNPVLVRDQARYLGAETIEGVLTSQFAYGEASTLWIDAEGNLVRFEGKVDRLDTAVRIDLSDLGPQPVSMPEPASVIPVGQVAQIYAQFTGG